MATMEVTGPDTGDVRFFRNSITAMAVILVLGFVLQLATGRSSFNAPLIVHMHAMVFMGWVAITMSQVWLASAGNSRLHKTLGVLAIFWVMAMIVLGTLVTTHNLQTGRTPFFFHPQHFVIVNPLNILCFAGVFAAAVALRHRKDWHGRLQVGAFALIIGPGVGRIIPMPLLTPYAFEAAALPPLAFIIFGMVRDVKLHGRVHPAWYVSLIVLIGFLLVARLIAFSDIGDGLYEWVVQGTPMEGSDGLAFPPPPPGMPM